MPSLRLICICLMLASAISPHRAEGSSNFSAQRAQVEDLLMRGRAEESRGVFIEAARHYARILEIWPNHSEARSRYDAIQARGSQNTAASAATTPAFRSWQGGPDPIRADGFVRPRQKSTETRSRSQENRAKATRETAETTEEAATEPGPSLDRGNLPAQIHDIHTLSGANPVSVYPVEMKTDLIHLRYALYAFALLFLGQIFFQFLLLILLMIALFQRRF